MGRIALTEEQKKELRLLSIIRGYKAKKKVNGVYLSVRCGCSQQTVSNWLNGKTQMPVNALRDIIKALGIPVEEIIDCL